MADPEIDRQTTAEVDTTDNGVRLRLAGRLNAHTLGQVWDTATGAVRDASPGGLVIDATDLTYCDGAGAGLFAELRKRSAQQSIRFDIVGLQDEMRALLDSTALDDPSAAILKPPPAIGWVSLVGDSTAAVLDDLVAMISFVGEVTRALLWAITHPHKVRVRDTVMVAQKLGADAVPVVCLLGFLIGLIIAFQSAAPMTQYGAQSMIPMLVTFTIVRELGPLITAIVLAGRSGSAFAAEIGTMKVTEELNALETFGLSTTRFLVVPRVLAAVLMTPLLCLFTTTMGVIGGYVVMASMGYSLSYYLSAVASAAGVMDLMQGLFKTVIFALLVASIGCLRGLRTASGPGAVGDSTTRAVVAGIVLVIVADGVLGVVFYYLGI